ncbi:MAG: outer membrane protein transport protein [Planctomycetes bacterium]|nr:outer membrane protein transport protein [Planctomycetota bacterium]
MKFRHLFFRLLLAFIGILFTQSSFAQISFTPSTINATPLPVGSGARAIGQGGAFIAVADDATAASWNPGALIQLERPELSLVGSFLSTQQDFAPGDTGYSLGDEAVSRGDMNYASVAYPFRIVGKNFVAALNYQQIYDFHMDLDFNSKIETSTTAVDVETDFKSQGGVGALTPAISMLVLPTLSIGVAVNFYTDEFFGNYAWKETTHYRATGKAGGDDLQLALDEERTHKNFQAVNVTTGLLWDVWRNEEKILTFGAVFKSPYTAQLNRITESTAVLLLGKSVATYPQHEQEHFAVDYPMSAGVGLGLRYNDALSFSTDIVWTDWSEYKQKNTDTDETSYPLGGRAHDTLAVKCGTEYLLFGQKTIIPLRGGLFYDPRPSQDDPVDVYGFSVGSGITFKRFSIDGAYQFRWANNGDGSDFGDTLEGTHFDLTEHLFLTSIIVYF